MEASIATMDAFVSADCAVSPQGEMDPLAMNSAALLSAIPNWPQWSASKASGVKWQAHFAPGGTSPRSHLLTANGQPQQIKAAQLVADAWQQKVFCLPPQAKRRT